MIVVTNSQTTLVNGDYVLLAGSIQVSILPPSVVFSGAKWRLGNGTLESSGVTMAQVPVGSYTVSFDTVLGWTTPSNVIVTITNDLTTSITVAFTRQGPPQLGVAVAGGQGALPLLLYGIIGSNYVVQASSDLVAWGPIATNTIPGVGFVQILDQASPANSRRFYRAVLY